MFISPRFSFRMATDAPGTLRAIIALGEGTGASDGATPG